MTAPQAQREPTMEEILASIRRIIAEEGQGSGAAKAAPPAAPPPAAQPPVAPPRGAPARMLPPEPAPTLADQPADGILLLTDLIDDEELVQAQAAALEPEPPAEIPAQPEPSLEFYPLPEEPTHPEPTHPEQTHPEQTHPGPLHYEPAAQRVIEEIAVTAAVATDPGTPATAMALPPPRGVEVESPLLTLVAEEAVAGSMREVAEAIRAERPAPATTSSTPLEGLVLEALRPALKSWIDQNLPAMVERLMRDEMRRLARRIEDE